MIFHHIVAAHDLVLVSHCLVLVSHCLDLHSVVGCWFWASRSTWWKIFWVAAVAGGAKYWRTVPINSLMELNWGLISQIWSSLVDTRCLSWFIYGFLIKWSCTILNLLLHDGLRKILLLVLGSVWQWPINRLLEDMY